MIVDEAGLLVIVVEGVLLLGVMIEDGVCLGLEDVIDVNRVVPPVAEVEYVVSVDV